MQNIQKSYSGKQFEIKQLSHQKSHGGKQMEIKRPSNQKPLSQITQLSDGNLLSQIKLLVQKERNLHIQVLHHLKEIESRKLYFSQGFSSLFDYAVKELGYSEGAAYRRIKAMRLCRDMPETETRLQSGRLSLSTACELQVFFEKQAKKVKEEKKALLLKPSEKQADSIKEGEKTGKPVSPERKQGGLFVGEKATSLSGKEELNKTIEEKATANRPSLSREEKADLIKKVEGCSRRVTEKLLSERDPSLSLPREKVRFLGKGKVEIKTVIEEKCHKRLEELKNLLSHKNPSLSYGDLLAILSEEGLKKYDPKQKKIEKSNKAQGSPAKLEFKNRKAIASPAKEPKQFHSPPASASKELKRLHLSPASAKKGEMDKIPEQTEIQEPVPFSGKKINKISRTIPTRLRRYIWERDGGRCTYIDHKTKRRCASKHLLQVDHIQPFAMGGKAEKENLRLLCTGHNQYRR